jgi:hypothetical protein
MTFKDVVLVAAPLNLQGRGGLDDQGALRQQDLRRGIVWGTIGAWNQQGDARSIIGTCRVSGQVMHLEGGAYVLRNAIGRELRVAPDENTRSDRPAHVGD